MQSIGKIAKDLLDKLKSDRKKGNYGECHQCGYLFEHAKFGTIPKTVNEENLSYFFCGKECLLEYMNARELIEDDRCNECGLEFDKKKYQFVSGLLNPIDEKFVVNFFCDEECMNEYFGNHL